MHFAQMTCSCKSFLYFLIEDNDNRFDHPTGSTYSNVVYLRSNPATINVTRLPTSAFIQPSSLPMPVANTAVNFRGTVALSPPVPPLIRPDIIEDDESLDQFYGSFVRENFVFNENK